MTSLRRWRGLQALVQDAVEHGSTAIERVHKETARRPFVVLERIPGIAAPARVVRCVHGATLTAVYGAIRLANRVLGHAAAVALGRCEAQGAAADRDGR